MSTNLAILTGRLTKDVEIKYPTNSKAVANITIAVDRNFTKQGEERQADFINCVIWDKSAEFTADYFGKGDPISIVGPIRTRSYQTDDGKTVYVTEVVADKVNFVLGSKNKGGRKNSGETTTTPSPAKSVQAPNTDFYSVPEEEDELPF